MDQRSLPYRAARAVWRKFKWLRLQAQLLRDHLYDLRRFGAWSHGTDADKTQAQALHAIYKSYHGVEKGLSLSEPRPGFGVDKIAFLMGKLRDYRTKFDPNGVPAATSALQSYQAFNAGHAIKNPTLETFLDKAEDDRTGGTKPVTRDDILAITGKTGADFFWSRHSVRQYADTPVAMEMIHAAVDMARKTPSVCNRQGARVHVFADAQKALSWQPGNTGFGHLASRALIVTADLQAFSGTGERNQPFVDGGMFAMSLLYALHAQGLGACPLAWSMRADKDRDMRAALDIPDSEVVIMMISVGNLPDTLAVAKSHRMELEHYMVEHD
ncbi:nitroreductase family protein [Loktanella sp. F6476L]|uniref:nitroreductase family protein n=1 Tax=Loktanella sp. F6476L TaxID=2926405 RepID=UPI001FF2B571|nr:nitroreductase family protein [Loktanella sp. F6476L]MCK0122114.1 nitroreductase family protein [Loktanella sp. F6476L]